MLKSSVQTQGSNRNPDILHIHLAPGPLERGYKLGLWCVCLLLPFLGLIGWLEGRAPRSAAAVFFLPTETETTVWAQAIIGVLLVGLAATVLWVLKRLLQPFNGMHSGAIFRSNSAGFWLGRGDNWQLLNLVGEQLVTPKLVLLRARLEPSGKNLWLWLWADGGNEVDHRRLRVLLTQ